MESTPGLAAPSVSPQSLAAAFAHMPDPRRAARVIYPLAAILAMDVAALLANHLSVLTIAEWGLDKTPPCSPPSAFPPGARRANRRSSGCFANSMVRRWQRRWGAGRDAGQVRHRA